MKKSYAMSFRDFVGKVATSKCDNQDWYDVGFCGELGKLALSAWEAKQRIDGKNDEADDIAREEIEEIESEAINRFGDELVVVTPSECVTYFTWSQFAISDSHVSHYPGTVVI